MREKRKEGEMGEGGKGVYSAFVIVKDRFPCLSHQFE